MTVRHRRWNRTVNSGTRVIDTTQVLAGSYAECQLAILGADVIKVESPRDPDRAGVPDAGDGRPGWTRWAGVVALER